MPNRYAPAGYNRRKFKTEEEALKYVRHKTGAGSNIIYEPNNAMTNSDAADEAEEEAEDEVIEEEMAFIQMNAPTIDEDLVEEVASASDVTADNTALDEDEQAIRDMRDHNSKVSKKVRDFLANYRPDHKVDAVTPGFRSL